MSHIVLSTADALAHIVRPPMLIEGIIPRRSITIVAGPTYSGKTFFALEAARTVAGFGTQPFMGRWPLVHHGNVLFIEQDAPEYDTGRALWALIKPWAHTLNPEGDGSHLMEALRIAWHPGLDLRKPADVKQIVDTANSLRTSLGFHGPEERTLEGTALIVFDTFRTLHTAEENSSTEMQPVLEHIKYIRNKTGAAILLLHHISLGEFIRARGSTAIEGSVDNIFLVKKQRGQQHVTVAKARSIQLPNWTYRIETTEEPGLGEVKRVLADPEPIKIEHPATPAGDTPRVKPTDLLQWLPAAPPMLAERSGKSAATIYRWLSLLEGKGVIVRRGDMIHLTSPGETATVNP